MTPTIVHRDIPSIPKDLSHLPDVLQRVYANRGITHQAELNVDLKTLLPFSGLYRIEEVVARLHEALLKQQCIVIIGDFDADGATSCVVALTALRSMGATQLHYLVPNRFDFGYGLTPEIVQVAKTEFQPDVIITVDNGIANHAGVTAASQAGIDVIITDHHLPAATLPAPAIIVNPNQPNCTFASKHLAGVGVIFYVMLALRAHLVTHDWFTKNKLAVPNMADLLDLVALGTVADVVPLDQNNRTLIHQGIQRIRHNRARPGIYALLQVAKRTPSRLIAQDLAYAIAPRLNAAGRLEDMSVGIACLLCENQSEALHLAYQLDELNQQRKLIEQDMRDQALRALKQCHLELQESLPAGLSLYHKTWHQGVVGILASRIKEQYCRPTIAFAKVSETELKGSARSIVGLHIRDLLSNIAMAHPQLIKKFGGHAMAAGLSLELTHFEMFSRIFAAEVAQHLTEADLQATWLTDGELESVQFTLPLAKALREAGPWGQAFPEPTFDGTFEVLDQRLVGTNHLKLYLRPEDSNLSLDAIAFNIDVTQWPNYRCEKIYAVYRLDVNEFQNRERLQLLIEYFEERKETPCQIDDNKSQN